MKNTTMFSKQELWIMVTVAVVTFVMTASEGYSLVAALAWSVCAFLLTPIICSVLNDD